MMYLITAVLVLATPFEIFVAMTHTPDAGAGLAFSAAFLVINVVGGALLWIMYLAYQLSIELRHGRLFVHSWLKVGPLGTDRAIEVANARKALILRPNFVEFEIPGATTRVWSGYRLLRDCDRFGTMWWFDADYAALQHLLRDLRIPTEYRRVNLLLSWVTSR